jgi:hypothetical protein
MLIWWWGDGELFPEVSENASIKNLTIKKSKDTSTKKRAKNKK